MIDLNEEAVALITQGVRDCLEVPLFARCIPLRLESDNGVVARFSIFITTEEEVAELIHRAVDLYTGKKNGFKIEAADREQLNEKQNDNRN